MPSELLTVTGDKKESGKNKSGGCFCIFMSLPRIQRADISQHHPGYEWYSNPWKAMDASVILFHKETAASIPSIQIGKLNEALRPEQYFWSPAPSDGIENYSCVILEMHFVAWRLVTGRWRTICISERTMIAGWCTVHPSHQENTHKLWVLVYRW